MFSKITKQEENTMINFNYVTKEFELVIPNDPTLLLFDVNQKLLPIKRTSANEYVQSFDIMNLPKYIIEVDCCYPEGRVVMLKRIEDFDILRKKLLYTKVSEQMIYDEAKSIFDKFVADEIARRKVGDKYEFIPKEIPKIEDFIISCALSYFK